MTFINSTRIREIPGQFINRIMQGDCIEVMRQLPDASVDFILTDPPYLVNFCDRSRRTLQNDDNDSWLKPAFAEAYRVLRQDRLMLSFYGWTQVHKFMAAWNDAGLNLDKYRYRRGARSFSMLGSGIRELSRGRYLGGF